MSTSREYRVALACGLVFVASINGIGVVATLLRPMPPRFRDGPPWHEQAVFATVPLEEFVPSRARSDQEGRTVWVGSCAFLLDDRQQAAAVEQLVEIARAANQGVSHVPA